MAGAPEGRGGSVRRGVARGAGPAGFMLAALLFLLLPMAAVSCTPGTTTRPAIIEVSFTGAGLVRDTPDVTTGGAGAKSPEWERAYASRLEVMDPAVRTLAAAAVVVTVLGVQAGLLRGMRRRRAAAASAATLAGVLLVVTERLALDRLEADARRRFAGPLSTARDRTELLARIHDAVQVRPGFWLVLGILGVILAVNLVLLARPARRARAP